MTSSRSRWRGYAVFAALAAAVTLVAAAIGYVPTLRLAGEAGIVALMLGCGISYLGSVVGALPIALAKPGPAQTTVQMVFLSMALRLMLVLGVSLAVALSEVVDKAPLLIWVAIGYVTLLVADTWYATRAVRIATEANQPTPGAPEVGKTTETEQE
jgi:hypothetical protein